MHSKINVLQLPYILFPLPPTLGGLDYALTEGDILAIFSQWVETLHVRRPVSDEVGLASPLPHTATTARASPFIHCCSIPAHVGMVR